jgi:penicillin-binding protein 1C
MRRRIWAGWMLLGAAASLFFVFYVALPRLHKAAYAQLRARYEGSYRFYDREGVFLREVVNGQGLRAVWVDLKDMPAAAIESVLAAEDERFFQHHGVDWQALARAVYQNVRGLEIQSGASTLSMQLARMLGHQSHSLYGKLKQVYGARQLEAGLSKAQILELYLNLVPVAPGSLGLEAGAREHFGSSLALLSRSQTALLAGVIKGPSAYDPRKNLAGARAPRDYVLKKLLELGRLTPAEAERAGNEPLRLAGAPPRPLAMHFTDYARQQLREQGASQGGDIKTSLDAGLNASVEALLATHTKKLQAGGIGDGAVVVIDNKTLEILCMVGSPDYWAGDQGKNNGATMLRQPGSTLKPFTYATAFQRGWSPSDVIADIPINYIGGEDKLYEPQNYSGRYNGPVTLHDALGRSLNVPAIRLTNSVGPAAVLETLHHCGFKSLDQDASHYGLGLTLGNGEVSLLELVQGYSVFANKGLRWDLSPWLASRHRRPVAPGARALPEETCYLVSSILGDEQLRQEAFGFDNPLMLEFPMCIKTGTSSNWRDNWVIGYTKDFSVGVWAGNFNGRPTNQYYGAIGAGPLFQQVARLVHESKPAFRSGPIWVHAPAGIEEVNVCPLSGALPNEHCARSRRMPVLKAQAPKNACRVHRELEVDTRNGMLATEKVSKAYRAKKVFEYLPAEYQSWLYQNNRLPPPERASPIDDAADKYTVVGPRQGETYIYEPGYDPTTQSIELKALVNTAGEELYWFVNGKVLESSRWPYRASLPARPGAYEIAFGTMKERSPAVNIVVK